MPELSTLNIENTTPVKFSLTVSPVGNVTTVTPIQKGNPQLEAIGLQYLKEFKFEPIKGNLNQAGTIELKIIQGKLSN